LLTTHPLHITIAIKASDSFTRTAQWIFPTGSSKNLSHFCPNNNEGTSASSDNSAITDVSGRSLTRLKHHFAYARTTFRRKLHGVRAWALNQFLDLHHNGYSSTTTSLKYCRCAVATVSCLLYRARALCGTTRPRHGLSRSIKVLVSWNV
jgi:hypothetical protein